MFGTLFKWLKGLFLHRDYARDVICSCGDCPKRLAWGICDEPEVIINNHGRCSIYSSMKNKEAKK